MTHPNRQALNWIDGSWVGSDRIETSINPATYEPIGTYAGADIETMKRTIAAAKRTFETSAWPRDRHLRAKVLHQMADAFERNTEALVDILSTDPDDTYDVKRHAEQHQPNFADSSHRECLSS